MKKQAIVSLIVLGISFVAKAQVLPPDFHCIKGDTLFWQAPVNTCGPFISYDIYFSQTRTGPYLLAGSVKNLIQTTFFHANPSKELRYYYLISNHLCPGQPLVPSDTLDNRPPEVSPLKSVSVSGSNVLLKWQASPSPEVYAYVIYRETAIGVVPIDTVKSGTTYTDTKADPSKKPESYFVNAIDKCGNTSIFDSKHNTLFLEASVSACEQTIDLKWNLYQNWKKGINKQEIWTGVNGAPLTKKDSLAPGAITYRLRNVQDGSAYCFYVRAVENETGEESKSNQVCLTVKVVRPMKDFYVRNVTVNPTGEVELTWNWDANAEIKKADIMRSGQNSAYQPIQNVTSSAPLPPGMTYIDKTTDPGKGRVYYKVRTQDNCDTIAFSTYGSSIFLTGNVQTNGDNLLAWTGFDIQNATASTYDIYRILKSGETKIGTVAGTLTSFADPFDPSVSGQTEACYYIVANATLTLPGGSTTSIKSRSNKVCMEQPLNIYIPNAFAPGSINAEFKPYIVPLELTSFEMQILDRYGNQLFVSTDPTAGWNGQVNGKEMPVGVYVYRIKVTRPNQKLEYRSGTVTLLR